MDPSRCIYACDSCGKAFTTKFNLKRHINMHCSRSREAGVPIQGKQWCDYLSFFKGFFNKKNFSFLFLIGPPSASQPSRKNKCKDEPDVVGQPQQQQTTSQIKVRRVSGTTSNVTSTTTPVTVVTTPMVKSVSQVTKPNIPLNTISTTPNTYQTEPMTVQLAVNAQGQPRILTTSKPASLPVSLIT